MSVVFGWSAPRSRYESKVKEFIKNCENEEIKEKIKLYIKVQSLLHDDRGRGIGDYYAYDDAYDIISDYSEDIILLFLNKKLKQSVKRLQDVDGYNHFYNEQDNELLLKRKKRAIKLEKYILEINKKYPEKQVPVVAQLPIPVSLPVPVPELNSNKKLYSSFLKTPTPMPEPQSKTRIPDSDDEFDTEDIQPIINISKYSKDTSRKGGNKTKKRNNKKNNNKRKNKKNKSTKRNNKK